MVVKDSKAFYSKIQKEKIDCPICQSNKYQVLLNKDRYGMDIQSVICENCSLIFINPRPTEYEMSQFYMHHYRKYYESIEVPTDEYIKNGPFLDRANFVINSLKNFLMNANSFIDIGCAEGSLIKLIEDNYDKISTVGIEPSIGFGNYAKTTVKGDIFIGTYQNFLKEGNDQKYDVLATTHVLEHILNPKEYLSGLKSFMHNDSVLYIEVPNIMHENAKGLGNVHIGHIISYDPTTIRILLESSGFEIIKIITKDLPALTPAMAVICKRNDNLTSFENIKVDINEKANDFKRRVLGIKRDKKKKSNLKSILSIFKK